MLIGLTAQSAPGSFYLDLYQRGLANVKAGHDQEAVKQLRIAAFGLVDSLPEYEIAYLNVAVLSAKLHQKEDARMAAHKIVQAERIAPTYAGLTVDAATRSAFEKLAPSLLEPDQLAELPIGKNQPMRVVQMVMPESPLVAEAKPLAEAKPAAIETKPVPVAVQPKPVAVAEATKPLPVDAKPKVTVAKPVPVETSPKATVAEAKPVAVEAKPKPTVAESKPLPPDAKQRVTVAEAKPKAAPPAAKPVAAEANASAAPAPKPQAPAPAKVAVAAQQPTLPPADPAIEITRGPRPMDIQDQHISPLMAAARHQPSESAIATDIPGMLAAAERMLNEGKILAARQSYLRLASYDGLRRNDILEIARGLNHTSAWRESSAEYAKVFPLQRGEEPHMFCEAVNRYEIGDYRTARELLARALPGIPATREVALYRSKIEATAR